MHCTLHRSVNDPFVMAAWGEANGADGKVAMLADTRVRGTRARTHARTHACTCTRVLALGVLALVHTCMRTHAALRARWRSCMPSLVHPPAQAELTKALRFELEGLVPVLGNVRCRR